MAPTTKVAEGSGCLQFYLSGFAQSEHLKRKVVTVIGRTLFVL